MPRKQKYSVAARIADAVGIATLVLGSLLIFVGEITDVFSTISYDHGGVTFVFKYLCAPVYWVLAPVVLEYHDFTSVMVSGLLVVVASAVLYGILTYAIVRMAMSILGIKP